MVDMRRMLRQALVCMVHAAGACVHTGGSAGRERSSRAREEVQACCRNCSSLAVAQVEGQRVALLLEKFQRFRAMATKVRRKYTAAEK